jgi:hypothetical protein
MAGDWIKMRGNLWDDPRVSRLVDLTDTNEAQVIGGLYWLWASADQHTEDGVMPGLSLRQIDRKTGIPGFGDALVSIGWLVDHQEGVRIVNFEEHNGSSAKTRASTAKRVASFKAKVTQEDEIGNARVTVEALPKHHQTVTSALPREEKRREEKEQETSNLTVAPPFRPENGPVLEAVEAKKPKPHGPPDCPHQDILALWAEVLPSLPQHLPEQWRGARADHLRARWRETATAKRWKTHDEGREYFRRLFGYVAQSQFLTGRAPTRDPTKRPFVIELEWLVSPSNWAKVHEGKYHQEAA